MEKGQSFFVTVLHLLFHAVPHFPARLLLSSRCLFTIGGDEFQQHRRDDDDAVLTILKKEKNYCFVMEKMRRQASNFLGMLRCLILTSYGVEETLSPNNSTVPILPVPDGIESFLICMFLGWLRLSCRPPSHRARDPRARARVRRDAHEGAVGTSGTESLWQTHSGGVLYPRQGGGDLHSGLVHAYLSAHCI